MGKVNAIIERAGDGTYGIYSDADDLDCLVTGTGKTVEEAKKCFEGGYGDMRRYHAGAAALPCPAPSSATDTSGDFPMKRSKPSFWPAAFPLPGDAAVPRPLILTRRKYI